MITKANDTTAIDLLILASQRRFLAERGMLQVAKILADASLSRAARQQIGALLIVKKTEWQTAKKEYAEALKSVSNHEPETRVQQ